MIFRITYKHGSMRPMKDKKSTCGYRAGTGINCCFYITETGNPANGYQGYVNTCTYQLDQI